MEQWPQFSILELLCIRLLHLRWFSTLLADLLLVAIWLFVCSQQLVVLTVIIITAYPMGMRQSGLSLGCSIY